MLLEYRDARKLAEVLARKAAPKADRLFGFAKKRAERALANGGEVEPLFCGSVYGTRDPCPSEWGAAAKALNIMHMAVNGVKPYAEGGGGGGSGESSVDPDDCGNPHAESCGTQGRYNVCGCDSQGYEPANPCATPPPWHCTEGFKCPDVYKCPSGFRCPTGFNCASVYWQWDDRCPSYPSVFRCDPVHICKDDEANHFGCPPDSPAHYACHMPAGYECLNVYACDNLYICPPEGTFLCVSTFHCQNDHECDHDPSGDDEFRCGLFYSCNRAGGTFECTPGSQFNPCFDPEQFQCAMTFDCNTADPYSCNGETYQCSEEYQP